MKKVVRYLQKQALEVSPPGFSSQEHYASSGSEPSAYILQRIEEDATKDGERQPAFGLGDLARVRTLDVHQAAANAVIAAGLEKHQYAYDNILQGYDIYVPELVPGITDQEAERRVWVIFIHGGYWCDPQQVAWVFTATRAMLLTQPAFKKAADRIAGYVSINYRLSPNANYPQDAKKTSKYEMREAQHPDQVNDVLMALRELQKRHGFGDRYLLCGHGCGATIAMQIAMSVQWTKSGPVSPGSDDDKTAIGTDSCAVVPPMAILGINGIYDIKLLRDKNRELRMYQRFLEAVFGNNEEEWVAASPAKWANYAQSWKNGKLVILTHSRQDELVDWGQLEAMERCWREGQVRGEESLGGPSSSPVEMRITEIQGRHSEIWQKGVGMAGPIAEAVLLMVNDGQTESEQHKD